MIARARWLIKAFLGAVTLLGLSLLYSKQALAHGLPVQSSPPLPAWLFAWSAALVLVVSFFILSVSWRSARWRDIKSGRVVLRLPVLVQVLLGVVGVGLYSLVIYAGLFGSQQTADNLLPTFVYVLFWVGFAFAAPLLGDLFSLVNPWRSLAKAAGFVYRKLAKRPVPEPIKYPERLGYLPAAVGLLCFVWLELIFSGGADPSNIAVAALVYGLVQLLGIALFGERQWSQRGDAFSVFFKTLSLLSPLDWQDGSLRVGKPLVRATTFKACSWSVLLISVVLGSTLFDSLLGGELWADLVPSLQGAFESLGFGVGAALELANTLGLVLCIAVVVAIYLLALQGMRKVDSSPSFSSLSRSFIHTLIPIALVYVMAHYLTLLLFQGQLLAPLISDPLGNGSDVFGTAGVRPNYSFISTSVIWYIQAGLLIVGHVLATVLAHDRALVVFKDARKALASQYWMLAAMVLFTTLGMWLLSAANY